MASNTTQPERPTQPTHSPTPLPVKATTMITKVKSLLEQLEEHVNVDADTYDSDFIRTMPFTPHDATSNQGFIHAAIIDPRNREIVEGVIKDLDGESWEAVYAVCVSPCVERC